MAHKEKMVEHHGARWGDKVRIIAICIDDHGKPEEVVKLVKAEGWTKVEHFHIGGSTAEDDYGVNCPSHVVLIDTEGKIAFIGYPSSTDLEKGIEKLLKGEKLDASGGDDEEKDEVFEELDLSNVQKEMTSFEENL